MHLVCPHCHNPIEMIVASGCEEILCPSCGSTFRIDIEATASWRGLSGRQIGRFELIEMVGAGTFGSVYKARDPGLDRIVAVKIPRAGRLAEKEDLDRFLREGRSVARLRHPMIVSVHEVGLADGLPYLVSEFIEGPNLSDVLTARLPPPRESAELIADLADALQYAHGHGVVHRDVKPSNILFDAAGKPHVTDFGLAKRDAGEVTMTQEGQVLGTPAYMSPEQARGEAHEVDGRSDVYSLGVILYRLLTGELPFRGNARMLLHQVLHDEPRPPCKLNDHIPHDLETICLRAMAKESARRYTTAREFAEDLRRYLTGRPIQARPVGRAERLWRWSRRNPSLAGTSLALLLALLMGFAGVSALWIRAENSAAREAKARRAVEDAEKLTARYLYLARMNLAQQASEANHTRRLLELLDAYRPGTEHDHLRSFEWYYWWRTCHLYQNSLAGHVGRVYSVAFSPDGATLASAGADGTVRLWDSATGCPMGTLEDARSGSIRGDTLKHTWAKSIRAVFSPDGKTLASAGADGAIKLWDLATGRARGMLEGHAGHVHSVAFSPDGATLASADADGMVRLWDPATGQLKDTLKGHAGRVYSVAFSPDGKTLASGGHDFTVRLWDYHTGRHRATLKGHTDWVRTVAFSPDGASIASGGDDFTPVLWDVATGKPITTLKGHTNNVNSLTFSRDGATLASTGEDGTVRLWDPATGRLKNTLKGHTSGILSVAFSPDGAVIASAGADGTVKLWHSLAVNGEATLKGHRDRVYSVAFSPDGATLASAGADGTVRLWDPATGRLKDTLRGHASAVLSVAFSPNGSTLASVGFDKTVRLWDPAIGRQKAVLLAPGSVASSEPLVDHGLIHGSVAFSPDGATLASSNTDRGVTLWDPVARKPKAVLECQADMVFSVAFSPDGTTLACAGRSQDVELWDPTAKKLRNKLRGHVAWVRSVAFSPDGMTLASSVDERTIMLWDIATGEPKTALAGHQGYILGLAFSPDGVTLASGGGDETVQLWRAATEGEVLAYSD